MNEIFNEKEKNSVSDCSRVQIKYELDDHTIVT